MLNYMCIRNSPKLAEPHSDVVSKKFGSGWNVPFAKGRRRSDLTQKNPGEKMIGWQVGKKPFKHRNRSFWFFAFASLGSDSTKSTVSSAKMIDFCLVHEQEQLGMSYVNVLNICHVYIYLCIYMYICNKHTYTYIYIYLFVLICKHVYIYISTCTYAIYLHIDTYIHIYIPFTYHLSNLRWCADYSLITFLTAGGGKHLWDSPKNQVLPVVEAGFWLVSFILHQFGRKKIVRVVRFEV